MLLGHDTQGQSQIFVLVISASGLLQVFQSADEYFKGLELRNARNVVI